MGYGGALILSGLARNLRERFPGRKIVFVYPSTFRQFIARDRNPDHAVYFGNRDIDLLIDHWRWRFVKHIYSADAIIVDHGDKRFNYSENDSSERIVYRRGAHAIQLFCSNFGIENAVLQPRIELAAQEIKRTDAFLDKHGLMDTGYVCIEPHSKESFTPNKAWFWDRWQELVVRLHEWRPELRIVQIGAGGGAVLDGAIDLSGQFSFRETGRVLQRSMGLISYMGGLVHLSKAVGRRNVVLISAWEPKELASYPDDINLYTALDCASCGLKIPCPIERQCMQRINVDAVFDACRDLLSPFHIPLE